MLYKFRCPNCDKNIELKISVEDYKRDGYKCEICGGILKRDLNDYCKSFKGDKDFYDKAKLK